MALYQKNLIKKSRKRVKEGVQVSRRDEKIFSKRKTTVDDFIFMTSPF